MIRVLTISLFILMTIQSYGQNNVNKKDQPDSVKVFVSFIVETDGSINNVEVDKIECKKCSRSYKKNIGSEAVRVVSEMPKLEEHMERTKYILPIKFKFD